MLEKNPQKSYGMPKLKSELRRLLIYSKIMTLVTLDIYQKDGYPKKYLISDLEIPEGALKSNIEYLIKNGYVTVSKEKIDSDEKEDLFRITEKGHDALVEILEWIDNLKRYKTVGLVWETQEAKDLKKR
ncbi:MAG: transcriptional regulator [Candidatus Micrarchaeaceae archaeon]